MSVATLGPHVTVMAAHLNKQSHDADEKLLYILGQDIVSKDLLDLNDGCLCTDHTDLRWTLDRAVCHKSC